MVQSEDLLTITPDTHRTVYVSGPMSGLPDRNFTAFHEHSKRLREMGFTVLNPAASSEELGIRGHHTHEEIAHVLPQAFRADITSVLTCDAVVLIGEPEHIEKSVGADCELRIARWLGKPIVSHADLREVRLAFPQVSVLSEDQLKESTQC